MGWIGDGCGKWWEIDGRSVEVKTWSSGGRRATGGGGMRAKGWEGSECFLASGWWDGYDGLGEVEEVYLDEMGEKVRKVGGFAGAAGAAGAVSLRRARLTLGLE